MTRYSKSNGKYSISGKSYPQLIGTRAQVWHNTAYKTPGGLNKNNLTKNKSGRIVSKAKHNSAKKEKRLIKHGYGTKKGKFGFVKLNGHSKTKRTKGGSPYGNNFSPSSIVGSGIDGQGLTDYGNSSIDVQLAAGMAGGRRRKGSRSRRGGAPYGNGFSPSTIAESSMGSGIDGQGLTDYGNGSIGVQLAAGMAGGRRRKGKGKMSRGGAPYGNGFSPSTIAESNMGSGIDGQGITDYGNSSIGVQLAAGMAGGRKRKGKGSRRRHGGTTKPSEMLSPNNPLNRALMAS